MSCQLHPIEDPVLGFERPFFRRIAFFTKRMEAQKFYAGVAPWNCPMAFVMLVFPKKWKLFY